MASAIVSSLDALTVTDEAGGAGIGYDEPSSSPRVVVPTEDIPRPSIEEASPDSTERNYTTNRFTPTSSPSISLSPPPTLPSTSNASHASSPATAHGQGSESVDSLLADLHISRPDPMAMTDMATAMNAISSSCDDQKSLLKPEINKVSSGKSSPRRRRSSSRNDRIRHEVADEEPPRDPFNEPSFQSGFNDAKNTISALKDALSNSSLHHEPDSTMRRLHTDAERLAKFQCPSSRTVGFVGDSGVGKSSLLNSLLDCRGLARTSNSGAACTCVVTEYHYHNAENFAVEVEAFSIEELTAQLTDLLDAYRHYHINGHRMSSQDNEKEEWEQRANLALDTFRAMFCCGRVEEKSLVEESESIARTKLISWACKSLPAEISGRKMASTLLECSELLMHLTSETVSRETTAIWPYIRKIKVFLKSHILSKGLVLVDLPGLRDLNSARQQITERYLLQCDEIFAICNIGRATTDVGVMGVFELARRARLSNVGIICTRSDDYQAEEAKKDWKGVQARRIKQLIDTVDTRKNDLSNIEDDLKEYTDDSEDLTEEEKEIAIHLYRRKETANLVVKQGEFELKKYIMETRSQSVMASLDNDYRDRFPGGLKSFCVSNTDYWTHRDLSKDDFQPYLELSGISKIRKHCIAMVANSQLRIANNYLKKDIPALLSDVELWVQSGAGNMSIERKSQIRETLNTLEKKLKDDLLGPNSRVNSLGENLKKDFQELIYTQRRVRAWSSAASDACSEWAGWHHASYSAFCRNFGNYDTPKAGPHNWNEEAMVEMIQDLDQPYDNFSSSSYTAQEEIIELISHVASWAYDLLEREMREISDSTTTLSEALNSRSQLMIADFEDLYSKLETDLGLLRIDALSGIRTSIFGQAMEQAYKGCNSEGGTGSHGRRKDIIRSAISPQSMFENHIKEFRGRVRDMANSFQVDLRTMIESHCDVIRGTLDIIRSENIALESEKNPEFRAHVEAAVGVAKSEMGRIHGGMANNVSG